MMNGVTHLCLAAMLLTSPTESPEATRARLRDAAAAYAAHRYLDALIAYREVERRLASEPPPAPVRWSATFYAADAARRIGLADEALVRLRRLSAEPAPAGLGDLQTRAREALARLEQVPRAKPPDAGTPRVTGASDSPPGGGTSAFGQVEPSCGRHPGAVVTVLYSGEPTSRPVRCREKLWQVPAGRRLVTAETSEGQTDTRLVEVVPGATTRVAFFEDHGPDRTGLWVGVGVTATASAAALGLRILAGRTLDRRDDAAKRASAAAFAGDAMQTGRWWRVVEREHQTLGWQSGLMYGSLALAGASAAFSVWSVATGASEDETHATVSATHAGALDFTWRF